MAQLTHDSGKLSVAISYYFPREAFVRSTSQGKPDLPIMFFIHGWPDSEALWTEQIRYFSGTHHCVSVTLPEFEVVAENYREHSTAPNLGKDFAELRELLIAEIERVVKICTRSTVILVGHDWGAYLTYLVEQKRPDLVEKIITMDVGGHFTPSGIGHAMFMMAYQWWLIAGYFVGKISPWLGNAMTRFMAIIAGAPTGRRATARMNYLYFYMWRALLFKSHKASLLTRYKPIKPVLYFYGAKKLYHFHSARWLQIIDQCPGSKVIPVEGCGHWFMIQKHEAVNRAMNEFVGI
jgi:pimeloyl-ACP methyl ester carboxylesterase